MSTATAEIEQTNTESILEVRNLAKRFGGRLGRSASPWVIRDMSFHVADGEFLTIVGPSGAGKSTLLNMIAQIFGPSEGEVLFKGDVILTPGTEELNAGWGCQIGYVTQDDNLMPWRNLIDNVLFPLRVQGRCTPQAEEHAAELLRATNLAGFEHYYPHELSGGMRKRAALIRTLVYDPPVILMDEPFGAVDAQTRIQLQGDLLHLWEMGRKTIIFVTHDIAEAIALADRTLVITQAPAHVASEHIIPIPRPRDVSNVFGMEGFADLFNQIRAEIQ